MGRIKRRMQEDLINGIYSFDNSSRFENKMHKDMINTRKQITAIKLILEECK